MFNNLRLHFDVLVNGKSIHEYYHQGQTFIEGRKGREYTLRFMNNTYRRVKIVCSVDGLNVMTGDSTWDRGYVVNANDSLEIPGWRKDSNSVAHFEFAALRDSYNQHNASGQASNIGVIGCKVFKEKYVAPVYNYYTPPTRVDHHHHYHYSSPLYWNGQLSNGGISSPVVTNTLATTGFNSGECNNNQVPFIGCMQNCSDAGLAAASPTMDWMEQSSAAESGPIGTGWGEHTEFKTQAVYYDFEPNPVHIFAIFYDTKEGLIRRGINLHAYTYNAPSPNPFPDGCPAPR